MNVLIPAIVINMTFGNVPKKVKTSILVLHINSNSSIDIRLEIIKYPQDRQYETLFFVLNNLIEITLM